MASIGALEIEIAGDDTKLSLALNHAQQSISSFGQMASGVFTGILGAHLFTGLLHGIKSIGEYMVDASSSYESYSLSLETLLQHVDATGEQTAESFGGAGNRMKLTAMEIEDEMINHTEKVKKLNDQIAEMMKGDNILKAREELNQRLEDLEYSHAQKIIGFQQQIVDAQSTFADRQADREQRMKDALQDMEDQHNLLIEDKRAKAEAEMGKTRSEVAKRAIQKQLDEELKLENDSFHRKYELRKSREERNIREENERDRRQTEARIKQIQDRIAEENKEYDRQQTKLREDSDKRIAEYAAENQKKLELYKQELADEERAHKMHMLRLQEQQSGGGGGSAQNTELLDKDDPYKAQKASLEDFNSWMQAFALDTPFEEKELQEASNVVTALGFNFKKLAPVIGDISASFHKSFGTGTQAIMDAIEGRLMMLQMNFGISRQMLQDFGAEFTASGHLINQSSFFKALERIRDAKFADGMKNQMNSFDGQVSNIKDKMRQFSLEFMGFDKGSKKPREGSIFKGIEDGVFSLAGTLDKNKDKINKFMKDLGDTMSKDVIPFVNELSDGVGKWLKKAFNDLSPDLKSLGKEFGNLLKDMRPVWDFLKKYIFPIIGDILVLIGKLIIDGIKHLIHWLDEKVKAWNKLYTAVKPMLDDLKSAWDSFYGSIEKNMNKLFKFFDDLGKKAKDSLSYLNPFAHHSPSLVEQVDQGVNVIQASYGRLANIKITGPSIVPSFQPSQSTYNYNSETTNAPQITQYNTFNVKSQATAHNIAEHLGFQLEHLGIV